MKSIAKISTLTLAVALIGGTAYYINHINQIDNALTEVPSRIGAEPMASVLPTSVSVPVRLDSAALSNLANELVPSSFPIPRQDVYHDESWTRGLFGERIVFWSITIHGSGKVTRTSPITVIADNGGFLISTTVHASFTASKGSLRETAEADAKVSAHIALDVNDKWEVVTSVTPSYSWINRPNARLFGLFNLSLGTVAEKGLNQQINKIKAELPKLVREALPLKEIMAAAWNDAHIVTPLDSESGAWLTFDPTSAHFLTPTTVDGDLILNLGVQANVALSTDQPVTPIPEALPTLEKVVPGDSGFRLSVPLQASYEKVEQALATAIRGPIAVQLPTGEASVKVEEVKVYPSAPNLVVGMKIDANLPDQWLDTKGWVYFSAEPMFDSESKRLVLKNIEFARVVDNKAVRIITAVFSEQIAGELEKRATVDLSSDLNEAISKANVLLSESLQKQIHSAAFDTEGPLSDVLAQTSVTAAVQELSPVSFVLEDNYLSIVPVVVGSLAVELTPLHSEQPNLANN